jgi:hypothetical protein
MALASQTVRTQVVGINSSSQFRSPRRRRRNKLVIAALIGGALIGGGIWAIAAFTGPKTPPSGDAAKRHAAKGDAKPPVLVEMGVPTNPKPAEPADKPSVSDPLAQAGKPQAPANPQPGEIAPAPAPAPPPAPAPKPAPPPPPVDEYAGQFGRLLMQAQQARSANRLVEARRLLNEALQADDIREYDAEGVRQQIAVLNETLLFSPTIVPGDPLVEAYKVESGDNLVKIVGKKGLAIETQLLQRVNGMSNPNKLGAGQTLKLVRGPFHAVVHKGKFRLDLYAGTPIAPGVSGNPGPDGAEEGWLYIRSFPVGLGEGGGTPTGTFIVKQNSKLKNPTWTNPRTGQHFDADDPKNPIGEHWLGLLAIDGQKNEGYGIHGTIDPASIGSERSMGCVRLLKDDVALVWEMLEDGVSVVRIVH